MHQLMPDKKLTKKREKEIRKLYEQYGQKLYQYAVTRWKVDEDTAWDMVYKSLFGLIDKLEKYNFESQKKQDSFVLTTFLNHMRNHYKKESKEHVTIVSETEARDLSESDQSENENRDSFLMANLKDQLDQLEDWERMLLLLRAQKMSYKEIANYIDKPENQLKVYYQRLKERLIRQINDRKEASDE